MSSVAKREFTHSVILEVANHVDRRLSRRLIYVRETPGCWITTERQLYRKGTGEPVSASKMFSRSLDLETLTPIQPVSLEQAIKREERINR